MRKDAEDRQMDSKIDGQSSSKEQPLEIATLPLNTSAMIGASAGTGKTYTITYLVLRLLLGSGGKTGFGRPLSLDELLVVTFTNAAASDLKERIREKIRQAREVFERFASGDKESPTDATLAALVNEMTDGRNDLSRALICARLLLRAERNIDNAAISTIHSFANTSLNQIYSFEAGSAFEVELTEDQELRDLNDRAHLEIWRELFYHDDASSRALLKIIALDDPAQLSPFEERLSKVCLPYSAPGVKTVLGYAVKGEELERFSSCRTDRGLERELFAYAAQVEARCREIADKFNEDWNKYCEYFAPYDSFDAAKTGRSAQFAKLTPKTGAGFAALLDVLFASSEHPDLNELAGYVTGSYSSYNDFCSDAIGSRFMNNAAKLPPEEALLVENLIQGCYAAYEAGRELCAVTGSAGTVARTLTAVLILRRLDTLCQAHDKLSLDGLLLRLDQALHDRMRGPMLAKVLRERYPVAMIDEFQDTDPVQFSIFRRLYLEGASGHAVCFLIGDPKQSIYRFRNADIHSYASARAHLSQDNGGKGSLYTLDTNYRSAKGVVEGVNSIFAGFDGYDKNADPFADKDESEQINFTKVKSHGGKLKLILDDMPAQEIGHVVYFDPRPPHDKNRKPSATVSCAAKLAQVAAQAVLRCLVHGRLQDAKGYERRVRTSDIAVLVRGAKEYELMAAALGQHGIPCVYYSDRSSVLKTSVEGNNGQKQQIPSEAVLSMLSLMEAMNGYFSQGRVLKLMGSPLSCLEGKVFCEFTSDEGKLEREIEILRECAVSWMQYGFLSAFSLWMKRHDTMRKLLTQKGGERRLTDYMQVAELLQSRHGVVHGMEAQIRYLKDLIEHDGQGISQDEVRRRLESERAQVKIYTIHKSKGLEFPVVMLPFLWGKLSKPCSEDASLPKVTYLQELHRRVLVAADPDGSVAAAAAREDRQEEMRLLYVALTRACAANFLFISKEGMKDRKKALCVELQADLGNPQMAEADFEALKGLFASSKGAFICHDYKDEDEKPLKEQYAKLRREKISESTLEVSKLKENSIRRNFTVSSYSAVTSGLHDAAPFEQSDGAADRKESEDAPRRPSAPDCFSFPAGTEPGTFLHTILEDCNFAHLKSPECDLKRTLCEEVRRIQGEHLIEAWYRRTSREAQARIAMPDVLDEALNPLNAWFAEITRASLPGLDDFSLQDLGQGDWIPEMDYLLPTAQLSVSRINELCIKSADHVYPQHAPLNLNEKQLCGFITGSLDLVFRAPMEGRRRYFVADYKSTLLGRSYEDYSPQAVMASVFDPRNRYDVQYIFYSLALHRFLKSRLPDYSYARDFGGVFYLYLRGMRAGDGGSGIFYTKPSLEIIEELEALFDGGQG